MIQYTQPTTKPWPSPNAVRVHTYKPPSPGKRALNAMTARHDGTKNNPKPAAQKIKLAGPRPAAVASHIGATTRLTIIKTTSRVPRTRGNTGGSGACIGRADVEVAQSSRGVVMRVRRAPLRIAAQAD